MTLERTKIRRRLEELAEPGYRDFNRKLLPGVEDMLGVRTPALRRLAREITKGDWRGYVGQVRTAWRQGEACHEERLLWVGGSGRLHTGFCAGDRQLGGVRQLLRHVKDRREA